MNNISSFILAKQETNKILSGTVEYIKSNVLEVGGISGQKNLQKVEFPLAKIIKSDCFLDNYNLKSAYIPNVEYIGSDSFSGTGIESIYLPKCTCIDARAFAYCDNLTEVYIPNVMQINKAGFGSCLSLTKIDLSNVKSIGQLAFDDCSGLKVLDLSNCEEIGEKAFYKLGAVDKIIISDKLTSIGTKAFYGTVATELVNNSTFDLTIYGYGKGLPQ